MQALARGQDKRKAGEIRTIAPGRVGDRARLTLVTGSAGARREGHVA